MLGWFPLLTMIPRVREDDVRSWSNLPRSMAAGLVFTHGFFTIFFWLSCRCPEKTIHFLDVPSKNRGAGGSWSHRIKRQRTLYPSVSHGIRGYTLWQPQDGKVKSYNVGPPSDVSWLTKAPITIVISTINHSYWSYKPYLVHIFLKKCIPSQYTNIAIENGHRNSWFTHYKWWIFPCLC